MSLKKKSAEGIKWSFIETIGVRLFSVSTYFLLAKLLDPAVFGVVALTNTFVYFSEIFVEQGMVAALIQRKDLEQNHLTSAFWGNVGLGMLLFALTYLVAPGVAHLYDEPLLTDLLRVHAITYILSSSVKVQLALLQRDLLLKKLAIIRTVAIVISCTVSIIMAYQGYGAWALVFQQILFNGMQAVMLWVTTAWSPSLAFSKTHYFEVFGFGSKVMVNRMTTYFIRYADTLLIGYFLGTAPLGYYSFAQKIFITLTELVDLTFTRVTFSVFSKLQDQRVELSKKFRQFIESTALVAIPLFAAAFVFSPIAIPLVFGDKWTDSISVIQILSVAGVLACFYYCLNNLFTGIGRVGLNLRIKLFYLGLSLLLMYGAVQFSIEAVAASYIIAMLVILSIMLFYIRSSIDFELRKYARAFMEPLAVCSLIVALVYGSSYLTQDNTWLVLFLQVLVSGGLYLVYLLRTKPELVASFRSISATKKA
ncbi:MAG: lipopolysaccharide biosynthesis protein [Tunicatimonas sp.]